MIPSEVLIIEFLKGEGLLLVDRPNKDGKWSKLIRFRKGLNKYSVIYERETCALLIFKTREGARRWGSKSPIIRTHSSPNKTKTAEYGSLSVNLYEEDSLSKIAAFL
jgi:hypothetical protein